MFYYPLDEYYGNEVWDQSANGKKVEGLGSWAWVDTDFSYSSQNQAANNSVSLASNYYQSIDTYPPKFRQGTMTNVKNTK